MPSFHSRTQSTRDDWQTPLHVLEALGTFDLDPCANVNDPLRCAERAYIDGGLENEWFGRVFLNPPYGGATAKWMLRLADHGDGIALIAPRMGAAWFHRIVLQRATGLYFLQGRLAFIDPRTGLAARESNIDNVLIAYGDECAKILESTTLPGKFWRL